MMTNTAVKPLSRALIAALFAVGFLAAVPSVAGAASGAKSAPMCIADGNYAGTMTLTVNPPQARPGDSVTIVGSGYPPNCELTVYVDGKAIGNVVTDANGGFTLRWTIPAGANAGDLDITTSVSDIVKHANLRVIVDGQNVVPAPRPTPPSTTEIPRTGSDVLPLLAGGVALMVLGSLVVLSTRKRSAHQI